MRVTSRPYQRSAVVAALKGLRGDSKRALVVLATGMGKTLTAAFIAQEFRAKRILFLVHNNFILDHAMNEFRLVFNEKTTMTTFNGLSKEGAARADIVFATWQTMGRNLREWPRDHFELIIVDEAHHAEAETYKPVLRYFTGPRLAITATPDRQDKADIRKVFGPEVANILLEEAIARGWLPRIEYHVVTDKSLDENMLQKIAEEIREEKKRFTMAEVNRRIFIRKRDVEVGRIINGYTEKAVVFCASIAHAERMVKVLDLSATFHSSKGKSQKKTWKKNTATLEALRNGLVRRVYAFNEGVDVPSVGLVAFCRVTEALTIFRQQLGRGLRPGKDKLIVLDFVGNLERIQLVLAMMNRISDLHEGYTSKKEKEREGYIRQKFEVSGKGFEFTFSDKIVDLMKVLEHCNSDFYSTWQEASRAAIQLGFTKMKEYVFGFRQNPQLPSCPRIAYVNYPGDSSFFGREKKRLYRTYQEASRAAIALGIKSAMAYRKERKADRRLPATPEHQYPEFSGWNEFLGKTKRVPYETLETARRAVKRLEIKSSTEYLKRYKEDSRLHVSPNKRYPEEWKGWGDFFNRGFYPTVTEASKAAKRLGIRSSNEYRRRYKEDPMLPSTPAYAYKRVWREKGWSWPKFLGMSE